MKYILTIVFLLIVISAFCQVAVEVRPLIVDKYDSKAPNYHRYPNETFVTRTNKLSRDEVYDKFISEARFLAPVYDDNQPVFNGCQLLLRISMPGLNIPGFHPIQVLINKLEYKVTNYTLPDHILHPGKVERKIIERNDSIFISTLGVGTLSVDKFFDYYLTLNSQCIVELLASNGFTFAERKAFGRAFEKFASWLNERQCVVDYVWDLVDNRFVSFIENLPDKSAITSPNMNPSFIWAAVYPGESSFEGSKITKDNGAQKIEMHKNYSYSINGIDKYIVVFLSNNYSNEEKENCHACFPIVSIARFLRKGSLWSLEQFQKDFPFLGGPWGEPSVITFLTENGKHYVKGVGEDMHFGQQQNWTIYYNLEDFKEEKVK